jgi:hypothetical protein
MIEGAEARDTGSTKRYAVEEIAPGDRPVHAEIAVA